MTTTRKHGLIAALICFWAISLPCSSYAGQAPLQVFGTYTGVESYQEYVSTSSTTPLVLVSSGSNIPATFSFDVGPVLTPPTTPSLVNLSITPDSSTEPGGSVFGTGPASISSQSASGSSMNGGGSEVASSYFSATFESIMPDGQIVGGLSASAQSDSGGFDYTHERFFRNDIQFTTVPEPSSIVQGALAVLMVGPFAWFRGFGPRS